MASLRIKEGAPGLRKLVGDQRLTKKKIIIIIKKEINKLLTSKSFVASS